MNSPTPIFIAPDHMLDCFRQILLKEGFNANDAETCAQIFTENSLDGVYSHGVNRFARFVSYVHKGFIQVAAKPVLKQATGNMEQWDGMLAPGPLNALFASERAMALASKSGIGLVSLANTNHWMRGGSYGLHCAEKGFAFIGWTNTIANLAPWHSTDNKLGNNPLVFAVPYKDGAIVMDMAISQYSFGKLKDAKAWGQNLPEVGGYNREGEPSCNAGEILESGRAKPIGYWKGSALSLLLDILASILSGGLSTAQLTRQNGEEYGVSQVYIAIDLSKLANFPAIEQTIENIIADYHDAATTDGQPLRYPGEKRTEIRSRHFREGIPVYPEVWEAICAL